MSGCRRCCQLSLLSLCFHRVGGCRRWCQLSLLKYDRGVVNYLVGVDVCWGCPLHAVVNQINNWLVIIVCFVVGGSCFVLLVV